MPEPLKIALPPLSSQWRLIRDVKRDSVVVASEDAYGVVTEASPESITFRLEGRVVGDSESPLVDRLALSGEYVPAPEGSEVEINWAPLTGPLAGPDGKIPAPLTFLEDAIPVPTHSQLAAIQRYLKTFEDDPDGPYEVARVHPVSLLWPFSSAAEIPFDGLCIEFGFRELGADESKGEGQEVVVFGEDGAILEKVNFG